MMPVSSLVIQRAICLGFFLIMAAPMIVHIATPDQDQSALEKRSLQTKPTWPDSLPDRQYFSELSDYANDQFGGRVPLISLHQKLMWQLGESPHRNVIRGKDDWLFLKIYDPLLSQQLKDKDLVRRRLTHRARTSARTYRWLAERGIAYRHVVAANKMSVYQGYLPNKFRFTNPNASLEFFKSEVPEDFRFMHIYSDEIFENHPNRESDYRLYFKNDTHWSHVGASEVANAVIESLQETNPELEFAAKPNKPFLLFDKYSGDLAKYIGLDSKLKSVEATITLPRCAQVKSLEKPRWDLSLSRCAVNKTRVFLIGDSFSINFFSFFSERVGEVYIVRHSNSRARIRQFIEEYKPDVVIEEIVQRELASPMLR